MNIFWTERREMEKLDFSEQAIRKVAFTNSKEEADRLKKEFKIVTHTVKSARKYFPNAIGM